MIPALERERLDHIAANSQESAQIAQNIVATRRGVMTDAA